MAYQGSGLNGADGLGLRLGIPKKINKGIKKLGRNVKKVIRSPIFKGAVIGAAAGAVYQKVRQARKKKAPAIPMITPPNVPVSPAGLPLPPAVGGPSNKGPSMAVRQQIAEKIMAAIPLSPEEMAIVQAGWLGQGMKLAAEAAYGQDAYVPGEGQPLPRVTTYGKPDDNTFMLAGLGLAGLLLIATPAKRTRRSA
jgi:hypothetical protein